MKQFNIKLGSFLRKKREEKGYSLEDVAKALGVTRMAVSNWETGKRSMYFEALSNYCKILGLKMSDIERELSS